MFSVYCTVIAGQVLLDTSHIEALRSYGRDLVVTYRCACGERGEWRAGQTVRPWPASESA